MGHIKFITALVMTGLLAFALMGFVINFGNENHSDVILSNDPEYVALKDSIESDVVSFKDDVNSSSDAYFTSTIGAGGSVTESGGQFKVGIGTAIRLAKNSTETGFQKIFGRDNGFGVFITALIAILVFIGVMYGYKAWVGRNPD